VYGWIWRVLPGHRLTKAISALVLVAAALALLFFIVFPAVEPHLPINDVTVSH
jgi:hypothetical protein